MKRIIAAAGAIAALAFAAGPAAADWEKTHWGAKVADTILAVGGDTAGVPSDDDENIWGTDRGAIGKGEFDGIAVDRIFFFDAKGGLAIVKLIPTNKDCDAFRAAVEKRLGKPAGTHADAFGASFRSLSLTWTSRTDNLVILYYSMQVSNGGVGICHLIYQPYGDGLSGQRNADGKTIKPVE